MSEDMSEIISKDRSERMAKDMSERYVRRYVIRKSVRRFVRKNGKRYVRKMSERMSEDMSGRTSENMSQVYVHTQIWITRIHVCTKGILWMASFFWFFWHTAASTVGSTLFSCKEVSLVWKPWRRLWWNVLRRSYWDCQSGCQRSWACVALQVDFCWCWAHVRVHGAA